MKKIIKNIVEYLFKEKPILHNLSENFVIIFMSVFIKLALLGTKFNAYENYFEAMVIYLLVIILGYLLVKHTKVSGWGKLGLVFSMIGALVLITSGTFGWINVAIKVNVFLAFMCGIYNLIFYLNSRRKKA
jgi:hypothetical protein